MYNIYIYIYILDELLSLKYNGWHLCSHLNILVDNYTVTYLYCLTSILSLIYIYIYMCVYIYNIYIYLYISIYWLTSILSLKYIG